MQTAATVSGAAPPADPITAQLQRFSDHRRWNRPIAMTLHRDPELAAVAQQIANCSDLLRLQLQSNGEEWGSTRLTGARLCNRRLCPFCEWRRTRAWRARILSGLEQYSEAEPKRVPVFLTLTVRNCAVPDLRQTITDMHKAWNRLTMQRWFPTDAWMRRTELTFSPYHGAPSAHPSGGTTQPALLPGVGAAGTAHPHIHALLMVKPSYFSHGYITHLEWQKQWMMAARLDYPPIVDVRRGYDKRKRSDSQPVSSVSTVCEAAKYISKATDLLQFGDALGMLHWQTKGLRLYSFSSVFRTYIKAGDITGAELLDSPKESDQQFPLKFDCVAQWFDSHNEYRITPLA